MCERGGALTPSGPRGSPAESRARSPGTLGVCEARGPRRWGRPLGLEPARRPAPAAWFPPARPSAFWGRWGIGRGSMPAVHCALLAALLAAPGVALALDCPELEVASDVLTSLPGSNVTLTCPGAEPEDNTTVEWELGNPAPGSEPRRWAGVGSRLLLRSVQLNDSGNYSCYQADHPAGSVYLLVDAPPEEPQLFCFRKSPLRSVYCEWSPQKPPSPTTKAILLVKKLKFLLRDKEEGMREGTETQTVLHPCCVL